MSVKLTTRRSGKDHSYRQSPKMGTAPYPAPNAETRKPNPERGEGRKVGGRGRYHPRTLKPKAAPKYSKRIPRKDLGGEWGERRTLKKGIPKAKLKRDQTKRKVDVGRTPKYHKSSPQRWMWGPKPNPKQGAAKPAKPTVKAVNTAKLIQPNPAKQTKP